MDLEEVATADGAGEPKETARVRDVPARAAKVDTSCWALRIPEGTLALTLVDVIHWVASEVEAPTPTENVEEGESAGVPNLHPKTVTLAPAVAGTLRGAAEENTGPSAVKTAEKVPTLVGPVVDTSCLAG